MKLDTTRRIVIGSVLRPVDDHRMYEKLGLGLLACHKHEIHIVGSLGKKGVRSKNIAFHELFNFERLSGRRFLAPISFFRKLIQLKPEVVVVNSPDILIVSCAYKIIFGSLLVYDVLENYYANVMFANTYRAFVRHILAHGVRFVEQVTRPFIDEYWIAERAYKEELPFVRSKFRIIENKFALVSDVLVRPRRGIYRLLYSGTIAESYGIFNAIALVKYLHSIDPRFELTIVGFAGQLSVRKRLVEEVSGCNFISLVGIDRYVGHQDIIRYIQNADIGLLPYQVNQATVNRIPTKFYEYLALLLPFVVAKEPFWEKELLPYSSQVRFYNFSQVCYDGFISLLRDLYINTNTINFRSSYYTTIFSKL
ncbi:glycosyltransferase [Cytophagaceae bacterium DM2B3-1]|uniref:Glycosyltransferase n=1 Tax=Xanthocytophaga flava TaxID=3048013 RepID=A0ABT7CH94_9BACT|nr:glycosyltransferase [Xanthocytophaga flavus]MDJ1492412.1 glycosyltransferase [Xanthocytophaga flavus]